MKPVRIQRQRLAGWRMPLNTIYVGRGSKWGNPYILKVAGVDHRNLGFYVCDTLAEVVKKYEAYLHKPIQYLDLSGALTSLAAEAQRELKGKNLACWCSLTQPCHADVLLRIANECEAA